MSPSQTEKSAGRGGVRALKTICTDFCRF